jgi:PAS domain S-box-containing protein
MREMFKSFLHVNYHLKLIESFKHSTLLGVLSVNVFAPILISFLLFNILPHIYLSVWLLLHFGIVVSRIYASRVLFRLAQNKSEKVTKFLIINFLLIALSGILHSAMLLGAITYGASDIIVLGVLTIIITLVSGSTSTLGPVFHAFFLFMSFTIVPAIVMMYSFGGDIFNVIATLLLFFFPVYLYIGYKQYLLLRNTTALEETFETIFNQSTDGMMLIKEMRFKESNDSIVKMFNCPSKEALIHTHISKLMPRFQPDGTSSVKKMLLLFNMALRQGTVHFEWLHKKATGELFWCEIVLTRIYLENEVLVHGAWRDISARKKLEKEQKKSLEKIESLNKNLEQKLFSQSRLAQMGEMLAMIAHQWRQPLSAISSASGSLKIKAQLGKLNDETVIQKSDDIINYSKHLSNTINDFRDFFKPNKERRETDANELIESVLNIVNASIKSQNITLIKELHSKQKFLSYPNELKQVILNLIKNSQEAFLENHSLSPFIQLETYDENSHVIIKLSDNGGGIPSEIIDRIFDPYFSTKTKKDGTGLGLYMSKTIIQDHCSGSLHVKNSDVGAVFEITLEVS